MAMLYRSVGATAKTLSCLAFPTHVSLGLFSFAFVYSFVFFFSVHWNCIRGAARYCDRQ